MRKLHTDKKRLVPLILCSVLVLQQSFMNQANASNITDGNGNPINPHPGTGHYEIRPDAFNDKKVGFKEFQNLQLSEGDIMNFIFQWYNQEYGGDPAHNRGDIDTFVNFVNNRVEINGIVNALTQLGGQIKDNGNLVFISPNGMVVGSSGVLNVGSLQVLTPTQDSFNALKSGIPVADIDSTTNMSLSQQISKEWDPNAVVLGNGNITIDGRILARHDAELSGGNINMGSGGILLAGVGNQTEMLTDKAAADTLFQSLVNADNMNIANGFANNNGKIIITSNKGTNFEAGSKVKNFGMLSETTITNTGSEGVRIAGEVSNPNGILSITNKAGGINIESTATLKNKGEMVITGQDADTGIIINGTLTNDGNLTITENTTSGTTGIEVGGNITNDTGVTTITNTQSGGLSVTSSGNITSNGTDLDMTNNGTDGFIIDGMVNNNAGVADLVNNQNTFDINGNVISAGDELNISNNGDNGLNIEGLVHNQNGVADILNNAGGLNVETAGQVTNDGTSITMTNEGDGGFIVDGSITNNNGNANLINNSKGFYINANGNISSSGKELNINNSGNEGLIVAGIINNKKGIAKIFNSNGGINVKENGLIENSGENIEIENTGTNGINIQGIVSSSNGDAKINNQKGQLLIDSNGLVENSGENLNIVNSGELGFQIDGQVNSTNGSVILDNDNNIFDINGNVTSSGNSLDIINDGINGLNIRGSVANNNGIANILNNAGGLNVETTGQVTNDGTSITMTNEGDGGFIVDGSINNNSGVADLVNNQNTFDINGNVISAGDELNISNNGDNGLNIEGLVHNQNGVADILNNAGGLNVETAGQVTNDGSALTMTNSGDKGFTVDGSINNNNGKATLTNSNGKMLISTIGNINSKGSELTVTNSGTEGMHIQGHVTHNNKDGKVSFSNINSNMVIGHDTTDFNITSDADININVQDGNLLNYGVASTQIKTTDNADLNITAQNGSIGEDLGLCDGGVCTGVGPGERDLTKSINTEIDGKITADSHGTGALINIASLNKDMHINKIDSDGRVILLADDKTNKGATGYDIINSSDDNSITPNIKGSGISAIASGDIGKSDNKVTFIQTGAKVDIANEADDASAPHDLYETPIHTGDGVEFLAIGNINIKGNDNADGTKNDTNVCTIASRTGTVNAEFSGNTYIRDITAQNEVNVVNRGSEIYIENLGGAPSRYAETGDYYGMYDGIVPEKANIKALDLGTVENPNLVPNSTIVIKNGVINGKGSTSHPGLDQDVTVTADNAYVGGYYFNMGKHRGNGLSEVTKDDYTNTLVNAGDPNTPVSIRGKAVRPDDVLEIGRDPIERIYYYADIDGDGNPDEGSNGSGQKDDPTFDPDKEQADDLVVPEPDEPTPPGDDDDDDGPVDPGDDDDDDGPVDPGDDDDDDGPVDPGDDDDDDGPVDPGDDDDDDGPIDPGDDDDDITMDDAKRTWKKEINDNISVIDKRQYMRFDIDGNPNPVVFESEPTVDGILNISRGGVQLSHNKSLKVGDIVPVHIKYGDIEIKTEVKIVSASDVTAGGEFINLDLATANQLLYLSLLMDGKSNQNQYYANTNSESLSTTGVDD